MNATTTTTTNVCLKATKNKARQRVASNQIWILLVLLPNLHLARIGDSLEAKQTNSLYFPRLIDSDTDRVPDVATSSKRRSALQLKSALLFSTDLSRSKLAKVGTTFKREPLLVFHNLKATTTSWPTIMQFYCAHFRIWCALLTADFRFLKLRWLALNRCRFKTVILL